VGRTGSSQVSFCVRDRRTVAVDAAASSASRGDRPLAVR